MYGSIESAHSKINEKMAVCYRSLEMLKIIALALQSAAEGRTGRKVDANISALKNLYIDIIVDELQTIESNYNLAIIGVLSSYYGGVENEEVVTREYYRIITSENFTASINGSINKTINIINILNGALKCNLLTKPVTNEMSYKLGDICKSIEYGRAISVNAALEKKNYEVCKCGSRMTVIPEFSKLKCPSCGKIKDIIGTVFRDDQFYPQEGQKTKHGGYDTSRHYRFHIDRLQALENKTFDDADLENIEYVLKRDCYDRKRLTCEQIRDILKDPKVDATGLNDHAPLLVKILGGVPPPQLNFQENKIASIRFNKSMRLYDIVIPKGGNKPYYPYFIFKILEYQLRDNPEKLRLLDYVHLQSRETVIKNDKTYEQMCILSDKDDGLFYTPTDPARVHYSM